MPFCYVIYTAAYGNMESMQHIWSENYFVNIYIGQHSKANLVLIQRSHIRCPQKVCQWQSMIYCFCYILKAFKFEIKQCILDESIDSLFISWRLHACMFTLLQKILFFQLVLFCESTSGLFFMSFQTADNFLIYTVSVLLFGLSSSVLSLQISCFSTIVFSLVSMMVYAF